jgi:hypothetical protein
MSIGRIALIYVNSEVLLMEIAKTFPFYLAFSRQQSAFSFQLAFGLGLTADS